LTRRCFKSIILQTKEGYALKLIAQVKLQTTPEQHKALMDTILRSNECANALSSWAWESQTFRQYDLHKAKYFELKEQFGLGAQVTIRCISKVSDSYKKDKKTKRVFKDTGSIAFDSRILSWKMKDQSVNIWTLVGRLRVPFLAGKKQLELLEHRRGEADLVLSKGIFYLLQVCEIPELPEFEPKGFLGVDLGIVSLATTSDGDTFSGEATDKVREKATELKRALQSRGGKSSKRHLKKFSGKEARFKKNTNHVISKKIVFLAKDTCRAIVIEDLKGFNGRTTVSKAQRERFGRWSFGQLRGYIEYKAKREGVPVIAVNPRNTSRTCSVCGFVSKKNRKSQALFSCTKCGFTTHADLNAAINLSFKGNPVNLPIAVHADSQLLPFLELQASDFSQG
jgi:IS605 OrfB family transposase